MFNSILIKRRPWWSILGMGAPASLSGGELAFNDIDQTLYYGLSTETAGISAIAIAGPGAFVSRTLSQDVSGEKTFIDKTYFKSNVEMSQDLTVFGNLSVLGDFTQIDTNVTTTSAFEITNYGSTTALTVTQVDGSNDVAEFKDGSNTSLIVKGSGFVGVNTFDPNKTFTVVGDVSATGTLDITSATTLQDTLYVANAATFANTVSANSTLTVEGLATFNNDVTVVDKLQVQSSDFNPGVAGNHVEVEGTTVKVVQDGATSVEANYGLNGISTTNANATYTIQTDNSQEILISANGGGNDIDLQASNVNITTGDLEVQSGDLNGNGANFINDFIIDGGTF
jgi:hypothetical protein